MSEHWAELSSEMELAIGEAKNRGCTDEELTAFACGHMAIRLDAICKLAMHRAEERNAWRKACQFMYAEGVRQAELSGCGCYPYPNKIWLEIKRLIAEAEELGQ